jgi:hypothetical protein
MERAWTVQASAGMPPFGAGYWRAEAKKERAGSYSQNSWLGCGPWWYRNNWSQPADQVFLIEGDMSFPSQTPAFADGVAPWVFPEAANPPAANLFTGEPSPIGPYGSMRYLTIPRHGSRPSKITTNHLAHLKLPGAINTALYDGHVEQVKLERLWQLNWHKTYAPPSKRRGL